MAETVISVLHIRKTRQQSVTHVADRSSFGFDTRDLLLLLLFPRMESGQPWKAHRGFEKLVFERWLLFFLLCGLCRPWFGHVSIWASTIGCLPTNGDSILTS